MVKKDRSMMVGQKGGAAQHRALTGTHLNHELVLQIESGATCSVDDVHGHFTARTDVDRSGLASRRRL